MLFTASGGCVLYWNHQTSWNHSKYFLCVCFFLYVFMQYGPQRCIHGKILVSPLQCWAEFAPLVEIGIRYLKIYVRRQSYRSPLWLHPWRAFDYSLPRYYLNDLTLIINCKSTWRFSSIRLKDFLFWTLNIDVDASRFLSVGTVNHFTVVCFIN